MSTDFRFLIRAWRKSNFHDLDARIRLITIILVFFISLVGANHSIVLAAGTTYYVDNTNSLCSDSGPGTLAIPYCTLAKGASMAVAAGDTVHVLHGTYAETVYPASGVAGSPITFHADAGVTVSGNPTGFGSAFAISGKSYVVVDGFNVMNTKYKGIYVDSSNHITISNNHVSYAGDPTNTDLHVQGIYLKSTTDSTVTGNVADHNTCIGIRLVDSDYNTISNNISFANASVVVTDAAGIELTGSNYNAVIHNITYGNEDSGINIYYHATYGGSSNNTVIGNLTYGNGDHGIDNNNSPYNTVVGNTVHGNGTVGVNFEGEIGFGSHHATIANNISTGNGLTPPSGSFGGNLRVDMNSVTGTTLDYDIFNLEGATVQIIWNDTNYASLAAFRVAEPTQEVHGLQSDPLFVAPVASVLRITGVGFATSETTGDYHLSGGSPAIDSANSSAPSQSSTDIEGNARTDDAATPNTGVGTRLYDDRGAYEFIPSGTNVLPMVTTQAVTSILQTMATGNGNVTSLGVPNPTQHGVVWSTSPNPTTLDSKTMDGPVSTTGAFTSAITGLTPATLYHVRAYATNAAGTAYGSDVTFTTLAASGNTGFVFANATVVSSSVTTPDNGWTSNNSYATFNSSSDTADYGFPDLVIPADATIDGIEVTIEGQRNGMWASRNLTAALWNTSALNPDAYTASKTASLSDNDTTQTLGSPTDKWGTTWTVADFADPTFKIRVGATVGISDVALDAVAVKVYYTLPEPQPTTTTVNCGAGTPVVEYGSGISCVATVVRGSGSGTPNGNVNWTTDSSGVFATSPCILSGSGATATCSVTYTPSSVGSGSPLITANYAGSSNFLPSSGNQTVTVNPKALTITGVVANNKVYDGTTAATFDLTGASLVGVVAPDVVNIDSSSATGAFASANAGTWAVTASGLGLSGANVANYTLPAQPIVPNATIDPKAASVTPNAASKIYGNTDPALTGALAGFLPSDSVTATYSRVIGETVAGGPYLISATLSPAGVLSNYAITYNTANLTITPKAASVTPNAASKIYGNTDPALTGTLAGFLPADGVTATYSRVTGETVAGSPYLISATLSPAGVLGNYTISYGNANFTINSKALTITGLTANNKTYDRTTVATLNGTATLAGVVPGDTVNLSGTPIATFANKNVGNSKPVTVTGYSLSGASAGNYTVSQPTGLTANISAASLTVTGITANNKVYNGNTTAILNTGSAALAGVVAGDSVNLNTSAAAGTFADKNVGTGKTVTIFGLTLTGADAGNYLLAQPTASANVTARDLTVSATGINKVYDGTTSAIVNLSTDALAGDTVIPAYTSASFADQDAGTAKPVSVSGISMSGADSGNYLLLNTTAATTADITPLAITVAADAKDKAYGALDPALTYQITSGSLLGSDTFSGALAREPGETIGTYSITQGTLALSANYNMIFAGANLTISQAVLTVTAEDKLISYGDPDPVFTFTYSGFMLGDTEVVIDTPPTCDVVDPHAAMGTYPIVCSGGIDDTYVFSYVDGALTVSAAKYDDLHSGWTYSSGFLIQANTNAHDGGIHYATAVGQSAEFTFTGSQITLHYTGNTNRGKVDVFLDGTDAAHKIGTINQYTSAVTYQKEWTSGDLGEGEHTIRFVHAGAAGKVVNIDALTVQTYVPAVPAGSGTHDDTHVNWVYDGSFAGMSNASAYDGSFQYSTTVGNYAEFFFNGSQVTLLYTGNTNRGKVDVFLDGTDAAHKIGTINQYTSAVAYQKEWTSGNLGAGDHTIRFVHAGAAGKVVNIDAITVGTYVPPAEGIFDDDTLLYSSGFSTQVVSDAYAGGIHYTATAGESVEFTFSGSRFVLVYTANTNRGDVEVWDGLTQVGTIHEYSSTRVAQKKWMSDDLGAGEHTIRLVHPIPSGALMDIDAILIPIGTGIYDDTDANLFYSSGFSTQAVSDAYDGGIHYSTTVGKKVEFAFVGSQFTLTYTGSANRGEVDVYVDGVKVDTIDEYSATRQAQMTWPSDDLGVGGHIVTLVHASGSVMDIDAIEVLP